MARIVVVLALIAHGLLAQGDLFSKIDPRRDDWEAESLATGASEALASGLTRLLQTGELDAASFPDSARAVDLTTLGKPITVPGGLTIRRSAGSRQAVSARDALLAWSQPLIGAATRVKAKVIGVVWESPSLVTTLRIEVFREFEGRVAQRTETWNVSWRVDAGTLRLESIEPLGQELVEASRRMFREITRAVLPADLANGADLRGGGEYWPTRTDRVGESPLMGHQGLALGDVDGDGLEDLYVAMGPGLPNRLLLRLADGSVVDGAEAAGVAFLDDTKGVSLVDIDGDSDQDLLAAIGPNVVLARNDGKGNFGRLVAMRAPSDAAFYHLAVADYDRDGDLDIYAGRYVEESYGVSVPLPYHDANNGPSNVLFRNDGDGRFVDVTAEVGLDVANRRFTLAAAWADIDDDGDQDLYVANDFGRNALYRNDGGRFQEVAALAGVEDQAAGMGVAFADVDEDGDLDLYVTNMYSSAGRRIAYQPRFQSGLTADARRAIQDHALGNSLFLNRGDGTFVRSADAAVRMGRWGWGARFADLNGDGREDILAPNGFLTGRLKDDL